MYSFQNLLEDIGRFFRSRSVLSRLILVNTGIWLTIMIMRVFSFLLKIPDAAMTNFVVEYMALPANTMDLMAHPWTIFTYMFLHIDFFHLLFNMLWLFWFGKIFLEFLRPGQLLLVYLLGGIAGGALYILFYNIFPVFEKSLDLSVALGASASVMAIVTAISLYVPGYSVNLLLIGRVRIFYIALCLFILDFFMIRSDNAGGHIAHIGGALFGLSYILIQHKGMNFKGIWDLGPVRNFFSLFKRKKLRVHYTNPNPYSGRPVTDDEYNTRRAERQKKVDDILDKISKSGYESLTGDEKDFLFKSGNSGN
jgi:membrane associated rhomboid family serine protease